MATITAPLTRDLVSAPGMWRLAILLSPGSMDIAVMSMVEDNSLIYKHIDLPDDDATRLRAIEEAVYENPLLLSDFGKIDILVRTPRFMVIPTEISDDDLKRCILGQFWPDIDSYAIFTDVKLVLPGNKDAIVYALSRSETSFLQRTFPMARFSHVLTPMVRYFAASSRLGCSGKLYACLSRNQIDVIAYTRSGLQMAVTTSVSSIEDALYYILAALHSCGMSHSEVEIILCGDNEMRAQLTPMLRKFVGYVMPLVFPSAMFRAGKDAMTAPFSLMLIPLCE